MSDTVNIKKDYSRLNESLIRLFDESGVRRSFTVPYVSQAIAEHVTAVGQAAAQNGGLTGNMILSSHHSDGRGYGSPDGHSTGHPAEKLRQTIIPATDKNAQAVVEAAQKCIADFKFLLGDDNPDVQTAQGQLNLVKRTFGAGMDLASFGILMIQMMARPLQSVARTHSQVKHGGVGRAELTGPISDASQNAQREGSGAAGGASEAGEGSESPIASETQGGASAAVSAPSTEGTASAQG